MGSVDRLGWAGGLSLVSYGVRLGIRVNDPRLLDSIHERLPPGWKPSPSPEVERLYSVRLGGAVSGGRRRASLLYENEVRAARSLEPDQVLDRLESMLRLCVAEHARRRVFVHAGVVGWRGVAIIIPGRSFTGKSTLVAGLLRAGATYYSDEYAVLDARGRVHPFLKPVEIRTGGGPVQSKFSAAEFGAASGARPLKVALVLMTKYRKGARWKPRELSAGAGVLELLANTVSARRKPAESLAVLQCLASGAVVLKGVRGEAAEVVKLITNGSPLWAARGSAL
jgi:hypothetical protein